VVKFIKGTYDKGIKLAQNVIKQIEKKIKITTGIEKWAVDIPCY
jgi:hypothetical protein